MLKSLWAGIVLLAFAASVGIGVYGWWTGDVGVGLMLFMAGAAFSSLLAAPLLLPALLRNPRRLG